MKSTWTGLLLCGVVIYFGLVHSMSNPYVLLNPHALILVLGGTVSIAFLTYSRERLVQLSDFLMFGFLFRIKNSEKVFAQDLIHYIDLHYKKVPAFYVSDKVHPFMKEAFQILNKSEVSVTQMQRTLTERRNSMKRRYVEDAKILNNIAKYPPHLGLLGAASGMIEMMSGLGKSGIDTIGASMAIALTATLWGVGLNNFVFLPLADNSMKAAEDEIYLRDIVIECSLLMKANESHANVIRACLNRLALNDRFEIRKQYQEYQEKSKLNNAA